MPMGMNATDAATAGTAPSDSSSVKYHLVEAEEVNGAQFKGSQPQEQQQARAKIKPGKLNWVTDSDDVVVAKKHTPQPTAAPTTTTTTTTNTTNTNNKSSSSNNSNNTQEPRPRAVRGRGSRSSGRGGANSGRRPQQDRNGVFINGVYVPNTDPKLTADWAKGQIEFYFSPDNLVRDIFLRQHMDVDGYVPLAFVGSFQAVFAVHQDYASLFEAVKGSELLELDEENEKIRLRNNWKTWLWPNGDGGYGVPRYIKLSEDDATATDDQ